ncbi:MAG: hypothetical protein ABSA46_03810 [Thermodesulfovibrionales bacterium]
MIKIMVMVLTFVGVLVVAVLCRPSFADECRSDLDCKMNESEKCIKVGDEIVGTCVKSQTPSPVETPAPSATPSSPSRSGQFCMTNKDCDRGQSCVKKDNAMFGACF